MHVLSTFRQKEKETYFTATFCSLQTMMQTTVPLFGKVLPQANTMRIGNDIHMRYLLNGRIRRVSTISTAKSIVHCARQQVRGKQCCPRRNFSSGGAGAGGGSSRMKSSRSGDASQRAAYEFYAKKKPQSLLSRIFGKKVTKKKTPTLTQDERNVNTAWYGLATAVGALGASYAAVPLYKVFCQTTGFGGTTQRVLSAEESAEYEGTIESYVSAAINYILPNPASKLPALPGSSGTRVHTWTDEDALERLQNLRPVTNADMITVRFDTTVPDVLPWSFVPVQLDVKVVPGETALSFFRVTNHSDKAITGVATYNVHPPKVGLYFQKIQCFCFEQQRLLPGETVDMPVFFFIDPTILSDSQVSYVKSVTLSYTFFQTDEDDDDEDDDEEE